MATKKITKTSTTRTLLVYLGDTGLEVGELQFSRQGQKEVSAFRYSPAWLRLKLVCSSFGSVVRFLPDAKMTL